MQEPQSDLSYCVHLGIDDESSATTLSALSVIVHRDDCCENWHATRRSRMDDVVGLHSRMPFL